MKVIFNNLNKYKLLYTRENIHKYICFFMMLIISLYLTGCNNIGNNIQLNESTTVSVVPTASVSQNNLLKESTTSDEEKQLDIDNVDYSDCFGGIKGCAVFLNSNLNVYKMYNKELCEKRSSPCSTFKIISTLLGLKNRVIDSSDSTMNYDGTIYPNDAWNKDLNLKDAFYESCVWYFRKVIDQVGQENVQECLNQLKYGNCDISEWDGSGINSLHDLNGFWLESSLEISPKEQVNVLAEIFTGKTDFSKQNIETLKDVLLTKQDGDISVYGKTGTGKNVNTGNSDNGWFVGMFEKKEERYFFAVRLNDEESEEVSGLKAKEIARNIINRYYVESN